MATKTRIVRIGNSRGIRLPRALLDQANLREEVELYAEPGRIIVRSVESPREGWAETAKAVRDRGEDRLLDPSTATQFDEDEWEW